MIGDWLVYIVTILYAGACLSYGVEGRYGAAIMYGSYCVANVGFLLTLRYKGW